jgi:hypothetical protein
MAVAASDMKWYLSGGSGNTNPAASLGGDISTTLIVDNSVANLFDTVDSADALAGDTEYRCAYIKNTHATDDLDDVIIWIESNTTNPGTTMAIGLDPAGIGNGSSPGGAAQPSPLDEDNPPPGVSFVTSPEPVSSPTALPIGLLEAGESQAVWFRRIVSPGTASGAHDPSTYRITGTPL